MADSSSYQPTPRTAANAAAARVAAFPGAGPTSEAEARASAEVVRIANEAPAPDWRAKALASQRLAHYHRRIALAAERRSVQDGAAADVLRKDLAHVSKRCAVLERTLHEALETLAELRDAPGRSRVEWEEARNGFNRLASIARDLGLDSTFIEEAA